jgi:deoxycytidylate deaminase
MSCAKKKVLCFLISEDLEVFIGENNCLNPQPACPREQGEGYEKCKTICQQTAHAEVNAIAKAGAKARGAKALVLHKRVCCDCQDALDSAGVKSVTLV